MRWSVFKETKREFQGHQGLWSFSTWPLQISSYSPSGDTERRNSPAERSRLFQKDGEVMTLKLVWNIKKVVTGVLFSWAQMTTVMKGAQGYTCRYQAAQLNFPSHSRRRHPSLWAKAKQARSKATQGHQEDDPRAGCDELYHEQVEVHFGVCRKRRAAPGKEMAGWNARAASWRAHSRRRQ